ncbi:hypothetical protein [Nocardia sp. R7R-8]|uniref:hypothetical protein n=1 Tax=Nocardia sp. R7R-8 TaxID=3459304 RepID=UPI00403DC34C
MMGGFKPRLRLTLSGKLNQTGLDQLRHTLGLARIGRLSDREDEHFGSRDLPGTVGSAMMINLWRDDNDLWSISIDAQSEVVPSAADLDAWRSEAEAAATEAGMTVVEERFFLGNDEVVNRTEWRNEDWLRAAGWSIPAQTLAELWSEIDVSANASVAEKREKLVQFMRTPAWEPAPARIKSEAEAFLHRAQ